MVHTELIELNQLFEDVQMSRVFPDGKTFVDCLPRYKPEMIIHKYNEEKVAPGFNLKEFVFSNFELPIAHSDNYKSDNNKTITQNIDELWDVLTRQPDSKSGTLISLPYPYIVPGGRFGEIYYWDSYFTMLGLKTSGRFEMVENMVNNFSYLIDTIGYIPNGNRTYFIGRSQPPFYSLMIKMLAEIKGPEVYPAHLQHLEQEYKFWMRGAAYIDGVSQASHHCIKMDGGEIMNRYWDDNDSPRPESFREDVETAQRSQQPPGQVFRNLRAGAESGWDFSSRWFKDGNTLASIQTSDIIPVDLNCLLLHLEQTIAEAYRVSQHEKKEQHYLALVEKRRIAIEKYCWNASRGFYFDYNVAEKKQKENFTLAGAYPMFFKISSQQQATDLANNIEERFLCGGGVVTTLVITGEQWDSPNGWAPLQWITLTGLELYGHHNLAAKIASRWIQLNTDVFKRTGKLMEKYNVVDTHLEAGGGEYAGQDGFGWTNGVLIALLKKYGNE